MFNREKVKKLKQEIKGMKVRVEAELKGSQQKLAGENAKLTLKISELSSSLDDAKNKVRTQTEADVHFASAKIMRELENGKKINEVAEQIDRRDMMYAEMQRQSSNQFNLLQSLGLGRC